MPSGERTSARHRPWMAVTRLLGVVVVLALVVRFWDRVAGAWSLLAGASLAAWSVAASLQLASLFVATMRFSAILRALGHRTSLVALLGDIVASTGINAALLMGVGEVYRAQRIAPIVGSAATSGAVVVLDRVIGVATIFATAAVASLWIATPSAMRIGWRRPAMVVALVLIASLAVFFGRRRAFAGAMARPLLALWERPRELTVAVIASLGSVGLWLAGIVVLARGLGLGVQPGAIVFAAPLVTLATLLPVSVGGVGVREAGYVILLAPHGVAAPGAIALGLAQYSLFFPIIAAGAAILLRRGVWPTRS